MSLPPCARNWPLCLRKFRQQPDEECPPSAGILESMKETALWNHLRPRLVKYGKFQKISDRFTLGIPDVLGIHRGKGVAIELKEFSGVSILRVKFRPGQVRWLTDWEDHGGISWIAATHGKNFYLIKPRHAEEVSTGVSPSQLLELSTFYSKDSKWELAVNAIVSK